MRNNSLLVYPKEAREILGVQTTKFYELINLESFPKTRLLPGGKRPVYLRSEIEEWVKNLPASTDETIS